ncbi:uncharacterized protein TrAtP1_004795 [Trichoderma atroviride]|uniref:uncharacterized protein n=1 Tax=Hypocrea atroviridis TaxID=63577 RepID=UPI0033186736|nr:hypothetical protein TrAtP1_004795 [Trichoderma atroviride]
MFFSSRPSGAPRPPFREPTRRLPGPTAHLKSPTVETSPANGQQARSVTILDQQAFIPCPLFISANQLHGSSDDPGHPATHELVQLF